LETVNWKVEGMSCSNCALTIGNYLKKQGLKNVMVNLIGGDVSFDSESASIKPALVQGIESLGYRVRTGGPGQPPRRNHFLRGHLRKFLFCLVFTLPLIGHMFDRWIHFHWLMNPWLQLLLCLPVYVVGMSYFGRSALKSIQNKLPNMNVLIVLGATAAFVYSLAATILGLGENYFFYETAAAIITFIFFGNYIEDLTVQSTQRALNSLVKSQKVMASMIAFDEQHQEHVFPVDNTVLKSGDLILIKSGEQVPADCKILWGHASVNQSIITGEGIPVEKKTKDNLIGGSILANGTVKAQVTAAFGQSVLARIINLVKQAQGEKPPVQQLADRISAIFVPVVLTLALLTFGANYLYLHQLSPAVMRAIAVLVIACPCAMGLATPAAIAVGLGRAARNGILFRHAHALEVFKDIRQVVFDKTGTLTTSHFHISGYRLLHPNSPLTGGRPAVSPDEFKRIVYSLEKYSNHPIARCLAAAWKTKNEIRWKKIDEIKGFGMKAEDPDGNIYQAGSYKLAGAVASEDNHNVYVFRNEELIGWVDLADEVRAEAKKVVDFFKRRHMKTILLSGDRKDKCERLGAELGIDEVMAEQSPEQKLERIAFYNGQYPTAMIGDGINDAPALAKASIGVSLSDASHIAMQTADVVLMNSGIRHFPLALELGKHTYMTIRQNLFWAFFYNVVAIPVAALGFLSPAVAALAMGLSDVVLAANSVRLFVKKVI
jgi:Cu+-exporting ATPase